MHVGPVGSAGRSTPSRPEFHQLAIFLKVVEARSFAGAARLVGRSQPAISQAIARLEEIYGGDLFERRRGAPLRLTPIGEAILPSARTILDTIDQQMVRAAAAAQSRIGTLTLGIFPGIISGPLRAGIASFVEASPHVGLRLVEALPTELHRQINEREIDLMIVTMMPKLESKALVQERLWEERLAVALPETHALARETTLNWDQAAELRIILKASHVELFALRALLERLDRQVHIEQHDVSCTTLLDMVGLGIGATIIPSSAIAPRRGVVFVPIDESDAIVGVDAVWPKDDRNPLRHRLLSLMRENKKDTATGSIIPPATVPARDRD